MYSRGLCGDYGVCVWIDKSRAPYPGQIDMRGSHVNVTRQRASASMTC